MTAYSSITRRSMAFDWRLLKRQAIAESSLNPAAVSKVGAMGLMQFLGATWHEWGEGNPFDPEQSIKAGAKYMAWLVDRYGEIPEPTERLRFALSAYNWGRYNVNQALSLQSKSTVTPRHSPNGEALGRPRRDHGKSGTTSQNTCRRKRGTTCGRSCLLGSDSACKGAR